MTKAKTPDEKPKRSKLKTLLLVTASATLLAAAGAGAAVYLTGGIAGKSAHEDPNRPKLVARSKDPAEPAAGEEGKLVPN